MEPNLEVINLSKCYQHKWVLKKVSFKVYPSDILGIIGPNGAGKSTLLYLLLDLIEPTSGEVIYFNQPLKKEKSMLLKKVGFASNYVSLPYSLTVEENLRVFAHLYEVSNYSEKIDRLLEVFKLQDKKKFSCRTLSTGEMMRLNLARAFLNDPLVLLLDEPTAGLDPENVRYVADYLKHIAKERGMTIILTSHQLTELERVANKFLLLKEGEVLAYGTDEELFQKFRVSNLEELYFKIFVKG